jgi:RNA polymerase sigma-70 factor (ECF subfamily)
MRKWKRRIDPVAEEQAFLEGVYGRMKPLLHKLILSQGASEHEAEDILQEAFLRLWQKVETLRELPERKCLSYVYTTVRNTAMTYLGRKTRQGTQPLDENVPAPAGKGPEEYYLSLEKEETFRRAMERLDESSRQLLLLRYVLEEDDKEIALRFGVKPDSLRMMVSRARAKLKAEMQRLEEGKEESS